MHSKRGRKPVHIDLGELEKLPALHRTDEEIAGWFGVSTRTIENRRKRPEFAEAMPRRRAKDRSSVRRAQMSCSTIDRGWQRVFAASDACAWVEEFVEECAAFPKGAREEELTPAA